MEVNTLEPWQVDDFDDDGVSYIEVLTKSGARVCLPLDWYQSMDELIARTEKVLYTT